jgi:tetratricopeptide (TPR) repeat protein
VREFCLATSELIAGSVHTAARRYDRVRELFEHPVLGVDAMLREQGVLGSLHGTAQGMATDCNPKCLELADELERRGPFYAPHAHTVRMTHFAFRGESRLAELHLQIAESLAFQGSTAWSALSVLSARSVLAYVLTGNVIGLMRVVTDLDRMASLSPTMTAIAQLSHGHLLLMRGQLDEAIEVYERVLDTAPALSLCTYPLERAMHVRALGQRGEYSKARAHAEAAIHYVCAARQESDIVWRLPRQELALIEAHQNNFSRALQLLEACLPGASRYGSPLALGALHRDFTRVHALQGNAAATSEHFGRMEQHFRATENPWLIQQCSVLRAKLAQLGLIESGEVPGLRPLFQSDSANDVTLATQTALELETALEPARSVRC